MLWADLQFSNNCAIKGYGIIDKVLNFKASSPAKRAPNGLLSGIVLKVRQIKPQAVDCSILSY